QKPAYVRPRWRILHRSDIKGRIKNRAVRRKHAAALILLSIEVIGVTAGKREWGVGGVLLPEHRQGVGLEKRESGHKLGSVGRDREDVRDKVHGPGVQNRPGGYFVNEHAAGVVAGVIDADYTLSIFGCEQRAAGR